jgi:hypothetical protein
MSKWSKSASYSSGGEIGKLKALKTPRRQRLAGSSPAPSTNKVIGCIEVEAYPEEHEAWLCATCEALAVIKQD